MKKIMAFFAVLTLSLTMAACGGSSSNNDSKETKEQTETKVETEAETEAETEIVTETEIATEAETESETDKITNFVKDTTKEYYRDTDIDSITVNEDLSTDESGDYVLLINYTWNVQNSENTSKQMLDMYSQDIAARIAQDYPSVTQMAVFWHVDYLSKDAKWQFVRANGGMMIEDVMW